MKKFMLYISLFSVLFTGCAITPIIAPIVSGVIAWQEGEAHKYYGYNSDIIYRSVKRAAEDMSLPIERDDPVDNGEYYLIIGANNRFKIEITPVEMDITRLSIRIDFMGDKDYAELFYTQVDKNLPIIEFGPNGNPTSLEMRPY